jgi:hypothetical protein
MDQKLKRIFLDTSNVERAVSIILKSASPNETGWDEQISRPPICLMFQPRWHHSNANAVVKPIHPKAMSLIPTTDEEQRCVDASAMG